MLFSLINTFMNGSTEDFKWALATILLSLPVIILALSLHESAHGYIAYRLGDPTAKSVGRISLNPMKHFDILGFLCMFLFGYGWAKPVPVNTRYFKKPRRDIVLTSIAGPASNLILAFIFTGLLRIFSLFAVPLITGSLFTYNIYQFVSIFLYCGVILNVRLAIFNMIPVPPFDGSRLIFTFLPPDLYYKVMKYERYIYLGFLLLLFVGVLDKPLDIATNAITNLFFIVFGL